MHSHGGLVALPCSLGDRSPSMLEPARCDFCQRHLRPVGIDPIAMVKLTALLGFPPSSVRAAIEGPVGDDTTVVLDVDAPTPVWCLPDHALSRCWFRHSTRSPRNHNTRRPILIAGANLRCERRYLTVSGDTRKNAPLRPRRVKRHRIPKACSPNCPGLLHNFARKCSGSTHQAL